MPSQIICISHTTGAGGETVGRAVAERLGFDYLDEEIIARAAEWVSLEPGVIVDVERRKSSIARLLDRVRTATAETTPRLHVVAGQAALPAEPSRSVPAGEDLRALIRDVIRGAADEGKVVIVAHAASMALRARDGVLRVFVTASPETRVRRVTDTAQLDPRTAVRRLQDEDEARADYIKRFYDIDRELPTHYDLVLNTDVLSADRAADVVVLAAR